MRTKKSAKAARKVADTSTFLHAYGFKINIGKSQGNESGLVSQLQETLFFRA